MALAAVYAGAPPISRTCAGPVTKRGVAPAVMKTVPPGEKTLYRAEFLAQMPPAIHSFAAQRLASPRPQDPRDGERLRSMMLQRHKGDELSQEERESERDARVGRINSQ